MSDKLSRVLLALPGILGVGVAFGLAAIVLAWNPESVAVKYRELADDGLLNGLPRLTLVAAQRLLELNRGNRQEIYFLLAKANRDLGRVAEANSLLAIAAPPDEPGYAAAHAFVARELLARRPLTPADRELARTHLGFAAEAGDPSSAFELARLLDESGNRPAAVEVLQRIDVRSPEVDFLLVKMLNQLGRSEEAAQRLDQCRREYGDAYRKSPGPETRKAFAEALLASRRFDEAVVVLKDNPDWNEEPESRRMVALVLAAQGRDLVQTDPKMATSLLNEALILHPEIPWARSLIQELTRDDAAALDHTPPLDASPPLTEPP